MNAASSSPIAAIASTVSWKPAIVRTCSAMRSAAEVTVKWFGSAARSAASVAGGSSVSTSIWLTVAAAPRNS